MEETTMVAGLTVVAAIADGDGNIMQCSSCVV